MSDKKNNITGEIRFPGQEDAEQGFPRYREYIDGLQFKKRVIEYINIGIDNYATQKQDIIYKSFSFTERQKFRNKYEDIINAINETYNVIVEQVRAMNEERTKAESNIREVFVYERNIEWLNTVIRHIQDATKRAEGKEIHEDLCSILQEVKSYRSPVIPIKVKPNEESGLLEINFHEYEGTFTGRLQTIRVFMSEIKALFISIHSFLDDTKNKDLYPVFMKDAEKYVKDFDIVHSHFSSTRGNYIRKKTKKTRTPEEEIILGIIERNERRGYTFPDYSKIEPEETLTTYCYKIWKKESRQ